MTFCFLRRQVNLLALMFVFPNLFSLHLPLQQSDKPVNFPFNVYTESGIDSNHFFSSGWMGDVDKIKFKDAWKNYPHSGSTCIQIIFLGKGKAGWAGIYWQYPENNWGNLPGAYDLTGAKKLTQISH